MSELSLRELDNLVAEKVMVWKKDEEQKQRWITQNGLLHESYWRPTYSINDAWQVIDALEKRDIWVSLYRGNHRSEATFYKYKNERYVYPPTRVIHESAPIAICLAALKIIGVEVEN